MFEFLCNGLMAFAGTVAIIALAMLLIVLFVASADMYRKSTQNAETPSNPNDTFFSQIQEFRNDFS